MLQSADYARILPSHTAKATLGHTIAVVKVPILLELIAQKNYLATPSVQCNADPHMRLRCLHEVAVYVLSSFRVIQIDN